MQNRNTKKTPNNINCSHILCGSENLINLCDVAILTVLHAFFSKPVPVSCSLQNSHLSCMNDAKVIRILTRRLTTPWAMHDTSQPFYTWPSSCNTSQLWPGLGFHVRLHGRQVLEHRRLEWVQSALQPPLLQLGQEETGSVGAITTASGSTVHRGSCSTHLLVKSEKVVVHSLSSSTCSKSPASSLVRGMSSVDPESLVSHAAGMLRVGLDKPASKVCASQASKRRRNIRNLHRELEKPRCVLTTYSVVAERTCCSGMHWLSRHRMDQVEETLYGLWHSHIDEARTGWHPAPLQLRWNIIFVHKDHMHISFTMQAAFVRNMVYGPSHQDHLKVVPQPLIPSAQKGKRCTGQETRNCHEGPRELQVSRVSVSSFGRVFWKHQTHAVSRGNLLPLHDITQLILHLFHPLGDERSRSGTRSRCMSMCWRIVQTENTSSNRLALSAKPGKMVTSSTLIWAALLPEILRSRRRIVSRQTNKVLSTL